MLKSLVKGLKDLNQAGRVINITDEQGIDSCIEKLDY